MRDALSQASESLKSSAATVRRASGHAREASDLAYSLENVEEALDDLSAGMARIAMAIGEESSSPGGAAWRLRTLHHALRAARDVCAKAKAAAPTGEAGAGGGR